MIILKDFHDINCYIATLNELNQPIQIFYSLDPNKDFYTGKPTDMVTIRLAILSHFDTAYLSQSVNKTDENIKSITYDPNYKQVKKLFLDNKNSGHLKISFP